MDLTPGDKLKATFGGFSADGTWFWASTNERDPKAFDVYRYNAKDYRRELMFTNKDAWNIGDVSDDGRWLALGKSRHQRRRRHLPRRSQASQDRAQADHDAPG